VLILAHAEGLRAVGAFEAAWRAFQLAVYAVGAIGTAITPFATRALALDGRRALLRMTVPGLAVMLAAGLLGAVALQLLAEPLSGVLYGSPDATAERAIKTLGLALPLTYAAYFLQSAIVLPMRRLGALVAAGAALCAATLGTTVALGHGAAGAATGILIGQAAFLAVLAAGTAGAVRRGR
jgi:O-antigen/teichoic acid export membrane protein